MSKSWLHSVTNGPSVETLTHLLTAASSLRSHGLTSIEAQGKNICTWSVTICFVYGATKWVLPKMPQIFGQNRKLSQEVELLKRGPHSWRCFQVSQMEQTLEAKSCQGTQIWEVSPALEHRLCGIVSVKLNWSHLWLKTAHRFLRQSPGHRCCHLWRCHEAEPGVVQQSESTGFFWVF